MQNNGKQGDPVILATRQRTVSAANAQLGLVSKHIKNVRVDAAQVWEHNWQDAYRSADVRQTNLRSEIRSHVTWEVLLHYFHGVFQ